MSSFQSLDRAIGVLFAFSSERSQLSAEEIARIASLPRGSVYRYINALVENGLLEKCGSNGEFKLGYRLLYFLSTIRYENTLEGYAAPFMELLRNATHETIHLTLLKGNQAVDVRSLESHANVRVAPPLGKPVSLHAGANNKVILAFRPSEEWDRTCADGLPMLTQHTITDGEVLIHELKSIRSNGYAISDQEMHEGAWGVAAPIIDATGFAIGSIGLSGPIFRRTEDLEKESIGLLVEYAHQISSRLRSAVREDPADFT